MKRSLCWRLLIACLLVPVPGYAQSSGEGLAHLVSNLILEGITLPGAELPGRPHSGHFTLGNPTFGGSQTASIPDAGAIGAVVAFGDRFRAQFSNFPLGSSTGGFTYSFDEGSGIYTRNSTSFGPAFTERASTIGRKKLSLGFNYQHTSFDTFGGEDLRGNHITFYLPHTDCCANPPSPLVLGFEGDIVEAALDLKATTDTFAMFANYGVTDKLDLGIAIPISHVDVEADVRATIIRLSTANDRLVHTFVEGQDVSQKMFSDSGTATGVGDIILRTKYNVLRPTSASNTGVSVALDLRLPTGDDQNLLGVGTTQGKFFLIVSSGNERFSPHVNIGYTLSGDGDTTPEFGVQPGGVSDEFNYAGGIEFVPHPKVTVLADFLGRTLINAGDVQIETKSFQFRPGASADATTALQTSTTNPLTNQPYRQLALQRDRNLSLMLGAAGVKFNPTRNVLVGANVLFPLTTGGLRDKLTYVAGIEYAF
jgi:hypothetical protein